MRLSLIIAFLALPLLEIALLIKLGHAIGFWATVAFVIGTGLLGGSIIRREGFSAINRFRQVSEALERGETPVAPVFDHLLKVAAGLFLIFPGVLTDILGCLLLIPWTRRFISGWGRSAPTEPDPFRPHGRGPSDTNGPIIEAEYTRLDD